MEKIILYFLAFFVSAFGVIGIHVVTRKEKIFGFVSSMVTDENGTPDFRLANTISECLVCMSSFWGFCFFTLFFEPSFRFPSMLTGFILSILLISSVFEKTQKTTNLAEFNQFVYAALLVFEAVRMYEGFSVYLFAFILGLSGFLFVVEGFVQYLKEIRLKAQKDAFNEIDKGAVAELLIETLNKISENVEKTSNRSN